MRTQMHALCRTDDKSCHGAQRRSIFVSLKYMQYAAVLIDVADELIKSLSTLCTRLDKPGPISH